MGNTWQRTEGPGKMFRMMSLNEVCRIVEGLFDASIVLACFSFHLFGWLFVWNHLWFPLFWVLYVAS